MTNRGSWFVPGGAFRATFKAASRLRGGVRLGAIVFALGTVIGLATPTDASSQEAIRVAALETERRLEYEAAASAYEGALAGRAAAEARFARITQELEDAGTSADDQRRNEALAQAQRLASELFGLDSRVAETQSGLQESRARYLQILDIQLDFLAERIEFASTSADSTELGAMYRDLRTRFVEVERDDRGAVALVAMVMPEITATPRDGPRQLRAKADLLELRAQQADSAIAFIDAQLVDLERRAQRDRGMNALQRGIERFDDNRVPVQPSSQGEDGTPAAVQTPEQRVASLRRLRDIYVERRLVALQRAAEFRALAGTGAQL